jgi:hypothetical protein
MPGAHPIILPWLRLQLVHEDVHAIVTRKIILLQKINKTD